MTSNSSSFFAASGRCGSHATHIFWILLCASRNIHSPTTHSIAPTAKKTYSDQTSIFLPPLSEMMSKATSSHNEAATLIATTAIVGNNDNFVHRTNGTTLLDESNPPSQSNSNAPTTSTTQLLFDPLDEGTLSSGIVLLRKQLEIFEATVEDVMARRKFGGIISVQQVGIRCTHCAHLPREECATNASCFPTSISQ